MADPRMTERHFQKAVLALLRLYHWRVAHFRPAMKKDGTWVTPVAADGAGFPDLFAVRPPRILLAELKVKSPVSKAQAIWIDLLGQCPGVETFIWHPWDWAVIETVAK
ncbi:hypothetical protein LCGC14_0819730 [marine sediment metagenome]|uniref:VRR-NUC domain-containing protein n=1 Tax=marine sediment metagenome TaxID=412755 RepID=A0A0F9PNU5_9ZZZZ